MFGNSDRSDFRLLIFSAGNAQHPPADVCPATIKPQDFWDIQIQSTDNEQTEIIFQPYSYEEQTFFQALSERSCLLAAINDHPLQVIFPGQSIKLHENDQIRLLWLVDPQLKSQLKSRVIPDQALVFTHGQLQEDVDHE